MNDSNEKNLAADLEKEDVVANAKEDVVEPTIKGTDSDAVSKAKSDTNLQSIKAVHIGIGAAGSSIASQCAMYSDDFKKPTRKCIILNTSKIDLASMDSVDSDMKFKFGSIEGTGSMREDAKEIMKGSENIDYYNVFFETYKGLLFNDNCILPIYFSTGGGSGSGAAPMFISKLIKSVQTYQGTVKKKVGGEIKTREVNDSMRPKIIAVAVLPALTNDNEGQKALQNTINCLNELNNLVEKGYLTVLLVSNDNTDCDQASISEVYSDINTKIAKFFYRFCNIFSLSDSKALDINDRLRAIATPGVMTVTSHDPDVQLPFIVPTDCVYSKMLAELNQNNDKEDTKAMQDYLFSLNIAYSSPRVGYVKQQILPSTEAAKSLSEKDYGPMIVLTGLATLAKVVSPYIIKLKQIVLRKEKGDETLKNGNEKNLIKSTNDKLIDNDSVKSVSDDDDLSALL